MIIKDCTKNICKSQKHYRILDLVIEHFYKIFVIQMGKGIIAYSGKTSFLTTSICFQRSNITRT